MKSVFYVYIVVDADREYAGTISGQDQKVAAIKVASIIQQAIREEVMLMLLPHNNRHDMLLFSPTLIGRITLTQKWDSEAKEYVTVPDDTPDDNFLLEKAVNQF